MKHLLIIILAAFILTGCDKNKIDFKTTCSYPGVTLTRTEQFADNLPAMIVAVKLANQPTSYQIKPGENNAWGSCNLPMEFAKDSLKVLISGYFLTFPGMELMNISPLPFEVTEVKPRN